MTTHAITLILSLAIPAILGIGILRRIGLGLRSGGFAYPAWVWIAGAFPIALLVFLWAAAGLLSHHALVVASGAVVALLPWAPLWRRRATQRPTGSERRRFPITLVAGLAAMLVLTAFVQVVLVANVRPVVVGDEAEIWGNKAQAIFLSGGITPALVDRIQWGVTIPRDLYHQDYPMLNPLLQCWEYCVAGGLLHFDSRIVIQLFGLGIVLAVLGASVHRAGFLLGASLAAAAGLVAFTTLDGHHAASDAIIALCLLVAADALGRHDEDGSPRWVLLAIIAVATMLFAKHEAWMLLGCLTLGVVLSGGPRRAVAVVRAVKLRWWVLIAIGPAITAWFMWRLQLSNDLVSIERIGSGWSPSRVSFARVSELAAWVSTGLRSRWLGAGGFALLWILAVVISPRRFEPASLRLLIAIGLGALGYALVLLGTPHELRWHLDTAGPRIWSQLTGLAALHLAELVRTKPAARVPVPAPLTVDGPARP